MSASAEEVVRERPRQGTAIDKIGLALVAACTAILVMQAFLIRRINVNWDEFYFLNHVHALVRGELNRSFQMAYTHLFTWLPALGDEMAQVLAGRGVMFVLFVGSAALLFRLASRWASPSASLIAVLCFLSAAPILRHGASFRADSMILPLILAAAVLITRPHREWKMDGVAGACIGGALAVSLKAALFLPLLVALALLNGMGGPRARIMRWLIPAAISVGVFAGIQVLHALSLPVASIDTPSARAASSVHKMFLEESFAIRWFYFRTTLTHDIATWLLIGAGAIFAIHGRRWSACACLLALLPIAIYRNSFPYFYVVMLAPASVLAAIAVDEFRRSIASRQPGTKPPAWLPIALAVPLLLQAFVNVSDLLPDRQLAQRETIAAVHQIFPEPVPYLDHSGMIASFPKVNQFMSGWGMDSYRKGPPGYMQNLLRTRRPPMLLANRGEIDPLSPGFRSLREEDRAIIQQSYLQYWGPVWVAGARMQVPLQGETASLHLPFPGKYRLATQVPLVIDGVTRTNGDVIEVSSEECSVSRDASAREGSAQMALVWAAARNPPETGGAYRYIYLGL